MRRRRSLPRSGLLRKSWRSHNREPVLESDADKLAFLRALTKARSPRVARRVHWYGFCLLPTRSLETCGVVEAETPDEAGSDLQLLGSWMRDGHSRFGAEYNRRHERQGRVAYDRPKTDPIESDQAVLEALFEADAQPMAEGKAGHPTRYRWSSCRHYAYGEQSEETEGLTPPAAYLALGATAEERQAQYRSGLDRYLRRVGRLTDRPSEEETDSTAAVLSTGPIEDLERARAPDKDQEVRAG